MTLECRYCGTAHLHPFVHCQSCEAELNPLPSPDELPKIWMPRHFTEANKGGYTQRELGRERDEGLWEKDGGRSVGAGR